ncbi:MAG: NAD-dependent epimerase/dehydratase family protein [Dokdonella sp.]|uniref:NAD-dependent epimerase/dehydratase family protein n=1 Tax=Dokdonella sp. TaxID=2291710 RepID=UPI0025C22BCE|nr:NAD-dependent epimerase/dehydratase family protein [Dokdonella sp.]MBZ0224253.1 NAD-dependent epimerase/dehydratase family protein [Dokdonella sp.]
MSAEAILVVGAGGFIGQALLAAFAARGERVVAVTRRSLHPPVPGIENRVIADADAQSFAPLIAKARAIVHLASASTPGSSAGKPMAELEDNLRPTLALLEALQARPRVPLLYVSSGGSLYSRVAGQASDELAAVYSRSYHGAGKIAAEHFIEAWCNQFAGTAVVLRPSNVYGPRQVERVGFGIVPAALGALLRGETLDVWGDGSVERDFLHIDDFTRLLLAALDTNLPAGFHVFNACSGQSVQLNALFAHIERISGRELRRHYHATRSIDVPSVHMRSDRAAHMLGWRAQIGLVEGLERTWRWFNTLPR